MIKSHYSVHSPPVSYHPTVGYSFSVEYDGSQFHHNVEMFPGDEKLDVASSPTAALPRFLPQFYVMKLFTIPFFPFRWQSPAWTSASSALNIFPQPAATVRQKAPQPVAPKYYGYPGSVAGRGLNPYFYYAPYQLFQG